MPEDADLDIVKKFATLLAEHFDTVQVFVTKEVDEQDKVEGGPGTVNIQFGLGNWFARYGQARTWLVKQDEYTMIKARKEELEKDQEGETE